MKNSVLNNAISIVDSHNKVLSAWADYRSTLERPPRLITLDHHTDTSSPFRRLIASVHGKSLSESDFKNIQDTHLNAIDYTDEKSVDEAIFKLNNDEHIVAAIRSNIISSAYVIAHNATDTCLQTYKKHKIVCHAVSEICSAQGRSKPDHNIVLESSFLNKAITAFDHILSQAGQTSLLSEPYILDVDLDYFNTFKSVDPKNSETFKDLVKNAALITIATEPEYVKKCAIDFGLSSEYILEKLGELMPENWFVN